MDYEINPTRIDLARAAALLRILISIREYLEFDVSDLAGSKETFNPVFAETLASTIVGLVRSSHWGIYDLISKMRKMQDRHS